MLSASDHLTSKPLYSQIVTKLIDWNYLISFYNVIMQTIMNPSPIEVLPKYRL